MPLGSDTSKNTVLNASLGVGQHSSIPEPLYLALFAGDPTASGVELSAGGYARIPVPKISWASAAGGVKANSVVISFPASVGAWVGVATYAALMDASTGGNLYDTGPLGSSIAVTGSGTIVSFAAGAITVSEA